MSYVYAEHRFFVFTEEGVKKTFAVIAKAREAFSCADAVRASMLLQAAGAGDSWKNMAVIDYLEESGYLTALPCAQTEAWQRRVFVPGEKPLP